jgi:hypothetical protein
MLRDDALTRVLHYDIVGLLCLINEAIVPNVYEGLYFILDYITKTPEVV